MKKLLAIVVLGLLLVSCNNSEKAKLLALENCGDNNWYQDHYKGGKFAATYERAKEIVISNAKFMAGDNYKNRLNWFVFEELEKIGKFNFNPKLSYMEIFKKVQDLSLEYKFKFEGYQFYFARCEEEYLKTPTTFIEKWKK